MKKRTIETVYLMLTVFLIFGVRMPSTMAQNIVPLDTVTIPSLNDFRYLDSESLQKKFTPNFSKTSIASSFRKTHPSHPFFCRLEDQFRIKNDVYFKFRLGSVEYVDYLEQKPHARFNSLQLSQ